MRLTFYTKPGCPLCEEARELLEEAGATFDEINIYSSPELFERYRYRVPVIRREQTDLLELRFTLDDLMKALQ
jgi:glutaredoxin